MVVRVSIQVFSQVFHFFDYFFGRLFNFKGLEAEEYRLKVGHKWGGGDDNNFFLVICIIYQIPGVNFYCTDLIYKKVVINRFCWYVHKGEWESAFFGANVFGGFVNAFLQVIFKFLFHLFSLPIVYGMNYPVIIIERKFCVYWNHAFLCNYYRIHHFSIFETILHLVFPRSQSVGKNEFKRSFSPVTALFLMFEGFL